MRTLNQLCLLLVALLGLACVSKDPTLSNRARHLPTRAQSLNLFSPWTGATGDTGWTFDGFLGSESEPDYAGSDDSEVEPDLFLRALYEDGRQHRYFVSLGELGAWWHLADGWTLGTVLEYEQGRDNENEALNGFEDVDDTLEGQFTLARRLGDFTLAAVVQPDLLNRGKGLVLFGGLGYDRMLGDRWRLALATDISTGDAEHMEGEFGISQAASAASGLTPYAPGAGLKSTTLGVGLERFFGSGWSVFCGAELEYYFSRAADSPLIQDEGSDLTYELGLGLRYSL